jgi:polar amino acid transport system substrate-binding protein
MSDCLNRSRLFWAVIVVAAASVGGSASAAADSGDDSVGRERLVVQVDYLVPEYKGGDKFRSPATIDTALAADLAKRLRQPLVTAAPEPADDEARKDEAGKDEARKDEAGKDEAGKTAGTVVQLTTLRDVAAAPPGVAVIPVGYRAAPMAIMRSDTTIKRWEDLAGRKVCVARGGNHLGTLSGRYGAIEQVHPTPTDAMIALRTGVCDALVHDSPMLEELIRLPEWKKFSARLRASQRSTLAFLAPAADQETVSLLRRTAFEWDAKGVPQTLVRNAVRNMAFEVYLEQEAPDCH